MKRLFPIGLLVVVVLAGIAGWGWWRTRAYLDFSRPLSLKTFGGTNYTARILSTTVGRADTGYVVMVNLRLENPNSWEVALPRDWFVLVDHDRDYYQPSTTGAQTAAIALPANGVKETEMLSYHLPADALDGTLAILLGHQHWVMLKSDQPYKPNLGKGEFIVFRRANW